MEEEEEKEDEEEEEEEEDEEEEEEKGSSPIAGGPRTAIIRTSLRSPSRDPRARG